MTHERGPADPDAREETLTTTLAGRARELGLRMSADIGCLAGGAAAAAVGTLLGLYAVPMLRRSLRVHTWVTVAAVGALVLGEG